MNWSDVLRGALSFFLVVSGVGIAYLCFRLGGVLRTLASSVLRVTDETLPILTRTQSTVDSVNQQLGHVDAIMQSAVGATKGAERAVGTVANAVTVPARKLSGLAARAQEQFRTLKARREARAADASSTAAAAPEVPAPRTTPLPPPSPASAATEIAAAAAPPVAHPTDDPSVVVITRHGVRRRVSLPYPTAAQAGTNGAGRAR